MYEQGYGYSTPTAAIGLEASRRATFINRTYQHLLGAILLFTLVEVALFRSGLAYPLAQAMLSTSWLLVLGAFMVCGWLFSGMAARAQGKGAQYLALTGYVLAEAIIFVPLLALADAVAPGAIASAAVLTLVGFGALTGIAMTTSRSFSFLGGILRWCGVAAILLIVGSLVFGFQLGMIFSLAMVVFAGAAILYKTDMVLRTYPEDRYVSAALQLFASVALMFWYILRITSRR